MIDPTQIVVANTRIEVKKYPCRPWLRVYTLDAVHKNQASRNFHVAFNKRRSWSRVRAFPWIPSVSSMQNVPMHSTHVEVVVLTQRFHTVDKNPTHT